MSNREKENERGKKERNKIIVLYIWFFSEREREGGRERARERERERGRKTKFYSIFLNKIEQNKLLNFNVKYSFFRRWAEDIYHEVYKELSLDIDIISHISILCSSNRIEKQIVFCNETTRGGANEIVKEDNFEAYEEI